MFSMLRYLILLFNSGGIAVGWQESSGTREEIVRAEDRGMPIIYLETDTAIEELKEITK